MSSTPPTPPFPIGTAPDHPRATTALIWGLVAVLFCQLAGPVAWSIGAGVEREIRSSDGAYGGLGLASAGKWLGIAATILLGLALLVVVVALLIVAAANG